MTDGRPATDRPRAIQWPVGHIRELDGVRAVAVSLVFLNHFAPLATFPQLRILRQVGWVGVDMFFVISGFLITGILLDSRSPHYYRDFFVRRALRIAPLYYAVLIALFGAMLVRNGGAAYADFVRNWGPPLLVFLYLGNIRTSVWSVAPPGPFVPLWSLHVEEQFYLLFPFAVRRLSPQQLWYLLWTAVVAALVFRVLLIITAPEGKALQYMLLPCRMDALAIGGLVALRLRTGPWVVSTRFLAIALLSCTASALLVFWIGGRTFDSPLERTVGYLLFDAAFGLALLWILATRESATTRWLGWAPLRTIGRVSYGIYILQAPAAWVVAAVAGWAGLGPDWLTTLTGATVLALVLFGAASGSWFFFESPILALKDRLAPAGEPARAAHEHSPAGSSDLIRSASGSMTPRHRRATERVETPAA